MWIMPMERLGIVSVQQRPLAAVKAANDAMEAGVEVGWLSNTACMTSDVFPEGHEYMPGAFVFHGTGADRAAAAAREAGCEVHAITDLPVSLRRLKPIRIGLYMGRGAAEFCYGPLKAVLDMAGFRYDELSDLDLRAGVASCDVLLVPGGPDAGESYYAGMGRKGYDNIRTYVENGGPFFGICAGAYLALSPHREDTNRYWMSLADATDLEGLDYWRTGAGFIRLSLSTEGHPVTFSLELGPPSTLDLIYWEGPAFSFVGTNVQVLATFDAFLAGGAEGERPGWDLAGNPNAEACVTWANPLTRDRFERHLKGKPALLETVYGQGRVLLYSPHAEFGSPGASPLEQSQGFMLIANGLFYLTSAVTD